MVTPSYAWYTKESLESLKEIWCTNIMNVATNNPKNIVESSIENATIKKNIINVVITNNNL